MYVFAAPSKDRHLILRRLHITRLLLDQHRIGNSSGVSLSPNITTNMDAFQTTTTQVLWLT